MRQGIIGAAMALVMAGTLVSQAVIATASRPTVPVRIPVCAEDEPYLRGRGDFNGRRWARYQCVHVDRIQGGGNR
jgi:hypothetical protein